MPQKLNKAGNMQNYVPAGNGEASGEYGDNATGSNKHFTAFEKPNGEKLQNESIVNNKQTKETKQPDKIDTKKSTDIIVNNLIDSDKKIKGDGKGGIYATHNYEKITEFMNSDKVKKPDSVVKIANAYQKAQNEGRPYTIYNNAFGTKAFFLPSKDADTRGLLCIRPSTFYDDTLTGQGTTWFHENGHLIDHTYTDDEDKTYSTSYVSKKYNDTLKNVLNKEFEEFFTPERKEQIIKEIEDMRAEIYAKHNFDIRESERQKELLNEELRPLRALQKQKLAEIEQAYAKSTGYDVFRKWDLQDRVKKSIKLKMLEIEKKYKGIVGRKDKEKIEEEVASAIYQNYSAITDMYSSLKKGRLHKEYGGYHNKDYWQSEDSKRVKEFFAECFSGYTLDNEHYKKFKQAFPKSTEIFEEIYNIIK